MSRVHQKTRWDNPTLEHPGRRFSWSSWLAGFLFGMGTMLILTVIAL